MPDEPLTKAILEAARFGVEIRFVPREDPASCGYALEVEARKTDIGTRLNVREVILRWQLSSDSDSGHNIAVRVSKLTDELLAAIRRGREPSTKT